MYESSPFVVSFPGPRRTSYFNSGNPVTTALTPDPSRTFTRFRQGNDLPDWQRKIRDGQNATTPFDAERQEIHKCTPGSLEMGWTPKCSGPSGLVKQELRGYFGMLMTDPPSIPGISLSTAQSIAKEHFVAKAKQLQTPFQGMVFMGELAETLHMIRHPALSLRKNVRGYLERLKKVPRSWPSWRRRKALSDTYLEAVFGWQPLMADISDGFTALKRYYENKPYEIIRVRAHGVNEGMQPDSYQRSYEYFAVKAKYRNYIRYSCWMEGGIKVEADGSSRGFANLTGFNLREFVPTAWELLPYSFLLDYFSNIGTVIDAWSSLSGRVAWTCMTSKTIKSRKLLGVTFSDTSGCTGASTGLKVTSQPTLSWKRVIVNRSDPGLFGWIPDFRLKLDGLSVRHMLNIGALLLGGDIPRPFY